MKISSEGYPDNCNSEEEKQKYVDRLNTEMPGLGLETKDVKRNMPRREFSKMLSNSALGANN